MLRFFDLEKKKKNLKIERLHLDYFARMSRDSCLIHTRYRHICLLRINFHSDEPKQLVNFRVLNIKSREEN